MLHTTTYPIAFVSQMEETIQEILQHKQRGQITRLFGLHGSGKTMILGQTVRRLAWQHPEATFLIWCSREQRWYWQPLYLETRHDRRFFIGTTAEVLPEAFRRLHNTATPLPVAPALALEELFTSDVRGIANWQLVDRLSHWSRRADGELDAASLRHNLQTTFMRDELSDILMHYEENSLQRLQAGLATDTATLARWLLQEAPPGPPADYIIIDHEDVLTPLLLKVCTRWIAAGATCITAEDPFRCPEHPDWTSPLPDGIDHCTDIHTPTIHAMWFVRTPQTIASHLNALYFPENYPSYHPRPGTISEHVSSHAFWSRQRDATPELPLSIATRWLSAIPFLHSLDFIPVTAFLSDRHRELFHYVRRHFPYQHMTAAPSRWLATLHILYDEHFGYLRAAHTPSAQQYHQLVTDFFSLLHMLMRTSNINQRELFDRINAFFTVHPMTRFIVQPTDDFLLPETDRLILVASHPTPVVINPHLTLREQYIHYFTLTRVREHLLIASTPICFPEYHPF